MEDGPPSFYDGAPLGEPAGHDGGSAASGAGNQAATKRAAQRARPVGLRVLPGGHPAAGRKGRKETFGSEHTVSLEKRDGKGA